jgi:hypothetical protein
VLLQEHLIIRGTTVKPLKSIRCYDSTSGPEATHCQFRKGMDNSGSRAVPVKTDLPMTVRTQLNIRSHRFQIKQNRSAEIAGCVNNP